MIDGTHLSTAERLRLEEVEGIVFDIQRYSLHDGPGIRTNVFLKGCPLRCEWCANPESQARAPQLALTAKNCMACGQFSETCPTRWAQPHDGAGGIEPELAARTTACPTGAIHWIGESRTAADVMQEVRRDAPFYGVEGGLTLTGGEATMQPYLAEALLRLAKAEGISTAIETAGHTQWGVFARLLPYLDDILFDVKHVDDQIHRAHTGVGVELILANLRKLSACNAPVTVRVPLIPGFNATPPAAQAIADFLCALPSAIKRVDLLPYHTLGKAKYRALGREYPWAEHARLTPARVDTLVRVFESSGFSVHIGG